MATRSLMALDYANFNTNSILRKHARNRPLGDLEHKHSYVPCQPVLSCRTVEIDLPGTRTYRPKSTFDILEEQQRLIRNLYTKQRAATALPAPRTVEAAPRSAGGDGVRRVNIEVKGRPLTSIPSSHKKENLLPVTTQRRPRTTAGRLKNVQPATDCFMIVKVDRDYQETTRQTRETTNQLRSYWKSENNILAQGKFVRGQKRPDDVPPTLDAWLTFGGAAGDASEGVIDAFASFKNPQEYYNIEGSVGSRVAQQLQKGDKIRIGINGVLQSQDLKVRRWTRPVAPEAETEAAPGEEFVEESGAAPTEGVEVQTEEKPFEKVHTPREEAVQEEEAGGQQTEGLEEGQKEEKTEEFDELQLDFNALMIGDDLDAMLDATDDKPAADVMVSPQNQMPKKAAPVRKPRPIPVRPPMENGVDGEAKLKMAIPLSWDDQCAKQNVKVIDARSSALEVIKPIMSETFPVKFEKLISGDDRPWYTQPKLDGFRVKQRSLGPQPEYRPRPTSSKVKVMYIDPLTQEEEERVQGMSVDEIVSFRMRGPSRESTAAAIHQSFKQCDDGIITINDDNDNKRSRQNSSKASHRGGSRPLSTNSNHSDRHGGGIQSPKLKTMPVHSSIRPPGDIGISTYSARRTPVDREPKAKNTGRLSPAKPLHKAGAGTGSSIKAGGLQQGDTEFIKITSSLRITGGSTIGAHQHIGPANQNTMMPTPYNFSPGSNTPRGNQEVAYGGTESPRQEVASNHGAESPIVVSGKASPHKAPSSKAPSSKAPSSKGSKAGDEDDAGTTVSESPPPTTVAISIPTADELSDRESPNHSPERTMEDEMTKRQRKAKSMRDHQIDQITDLIGDAIVDSSS